MKPLFWAILASLASISAANAQPVPYSKIYSHCLNADVKSAALLVSQFKSDTLNQKDRIFIEEFRARFSFDQDNSTFLQKRGSPINELLKCFLDYWRVALLNPSFNYDSVLAKNLSRLLSLQYKLDSMREYPLDNDTIHYYLKKYISDRGYHTTGYGKTGKLFDLLVWQNERDTIYNFSASGEKISSPVIFMDNFITLGWEEYATVDRYYPGGWATKEALYCVKKAYNLKSEDFLISYLCHEGKHFSDYKQFPKLSSADLEYRAKLTELSMLQDDLYKTIKFFIDNSDSKSQNGHSVANYFVIRDLSNALFKKEFETDLTKWERIDSRKIHSASSKLLKVNTRRLKNRGKDIENFIREG